MATLYRNYTVVVQDSVSPYTPNNDLRLYLYEGKVEVKPDSATVGADNAVFQFGTTLPAVAVLSSTPATEQIVVVADATTRPGEYEFENLDLDATEAGALGNTLYSVVAAPVIDDQGDFTRAGVIIHSIDISDPNIKSVVKATTGSTGSIDANLAFAGGTINVTRYEEVSTDSNVHDDETVRYYSLDGLPSNITALMEVVSETPGWVNGADDLKLVARFNCYYSSVDGAKYVVWENIPAYQMQDLAWVIRLQADEYCISRSEEFSTDFTVENAVNNGTVCTNYSNDNIHIRSYDDTPSVTRDSVPDTLKEKVCIHAMVDDSGNRLVGLGDWAFTSAATTPAYVADITGDLGVRVINSTGTKLVATSTSYKQGHDIVTTTTPYTSYVSSSVTHYGTTSNNYFRVDNTNTVKAVLNSDTVFRLTSTAAEMGVNIETATPTLFAAATDYSTIRTSGDARLISNASTVYLGKVASTYPRIMATATYVRSEASANTYWETPLNSDLQLSAQVNGTTCILLDANASAGGSANKYAKFGWEAGGGVGSYTSYAPSGIDTYLSGVSQISHSATTVVLSTNTTNTDLPSVRLATNTTLVTATASNYLYLTSSAAKLQVGSSDNSLTLESSSVALKAQPDSFLSLTATTSQLAIPAQTSTTAISLTLGQYLITNNLGCGIHYVYQDDIDIYWPTLKIPYIENTVSTATVTGEYTGDMFIKQIGSTMYLYVYMNGQWEKITTTVA